MNIEKAFDEFERRKLRKIVNIIIYLVIVLIIIVGILIFLIQPENAEKQIEFESFEKVSYSQLNESQVLEMNNLIVNLKPEYYKLAKSILFVSNQTELEGSSNKTIGINRDGEIRILYIPQGGSSFTLCHELLHEIIKLEKNLEEWFVEDIEEHLVCYK